MITMTRRRLLNAARELRDHGTVPPGVDQPEVFRRARAGAFLAPEGQDWHEAYLENLETDHRPVLAARSGVGHATQDSPRFRCCQPSRPVRRARGRLARPSGARRGALCARRATRPGRPADQREARRQIRPELRGREQARRQRRDRRAVGDGLAARRLHPAAARQRRRDDLPGGDEAARVRHPARPDADLAGRLFRPHPVRQPGAAVQDGQGVRRLRQGQSRQAELRHGRHRRDEPCRHRMVQGMARHRHRPRSLSRRCAGRGRSGERACSAWRSSAPTSRSR